MQVTDKFEPYLSNKWPITKHWKAWEHTIGRRLLPSPFPMGDLLLGF